ncbi:retention module-containing protein [Pseudomonas wadenswilerensis]
MSSVVAIVKRVVGQVIAVSPEGVQRILIEGDRLFAGDQVLTGLSGAVTLELADGRSLDLGRESQWSADAPTSTTDLEEATAQVAPSVEELQQAIAAGADPTKDLEATAAGPQSEGSGAPGGGHSVVMLDATAAVVDPTIGYETAGLNFAAGLDNQFTGATDTTANALAGVAVTLRLSGEPILIKGQYMTYLASVSTPVTGSPLVLSLSNGQTITIPVGSNSGSVQFTVPNDIYGDTFYENVSVTISNVSGGNVASFTVATPPVETLIVDNPDFTYGTLTADKSALVEGDPVTFTLTLSNPTQTPMSITLTNGAVINIGAGETTGSVNSSVPSDVYTRTPGPAWHVGVSSFTGGNFEVFQGIGVDLQVTNIIDTTVLSLQATPNVDEGGVITYTASLTSPTTSAMRVTLSNGQMILIMPGASSGSVQATVSNDVYNSPSVSVTITDTSTTPFENFVIDRTPAVTTITDSIDTTTVNLSASTSVAENGVITYSASVTSPVTGTPLIVTLSNGQTITIPVGRTTGSINVTAPNDAYNGTAPISTTITNLSGGNFESLVANPTPAVTTVTDIVDTTTVNLGANASVAENGVITYTASVASPVTGTPVVVALSNGQTITIPVGGTSGSVNVTVPNDVYNGASAISTTITNVTGGNFENLVANPAPAVTTVTDTVDTTTVNLAANTSVAENGVITYTASVGAPVTGTPVVVTLSNGQTITIPVGGTSGTVDVTAPNDVYNGAAPISTTITNVAGGNFENLVANPAPAVTTVTDSVDTTTVSLGASPTVGETGLITYTASVTSPVTGAPVIVTLSNGQTITIPVGGTSGTVQVAAPNDVYTGAAPVSTTIAGVTGGNFESLVANPASTVTTVTDTVDTTGLTLTATGTVAEGGSIVYTATLTNPAGTPVTVTLSNGATIVIAANQTSNSVTVAAPQDTVYKDGGNLSVTVTGTAGGNFENLAVSNVPAVTAVTDTTDTSTVTLTATPSVTEGGVVTYTASVTAPVTGTPVTVNLNNGQTIVIPVGQSSASVDFTAPNNVLATNPALTNSITGVSGGNYENLVANNGTVTTTVTDDPSNLDSTSLTLSATGTVAEGGSIIYTATLSNPAGTEMKVTLSNGETITIAKGQTEGSVTFAAPQNTVYVDAGNVSVTVTGTTGGDFEKLDISATPAVTAVTDTVDTSTVTLTATPSAVEGGVVTYTASVSAPVTGTALVVSLANGQSITIPVGQSAASVDFIAPNNVLNTNTPLTNSITGVTGGNYEHLETAGTPTTVVTDDPARLDTTGLTLSATGNVQEGGEIVYTARVTNPTGTEMKVTLSNGETITIGKGQTEGSITVPAPQNTVYVDAGNVSVTITGTTGGDFEKLETSSTPAVTAVSDSVDTSTVTLTATPSAVEGGVVTYTASVTAPVTGTALVISLANGQSITIPVNATSGSVDFIAPNNVLNTNTPLTNSITGVTGGNYEHLETAGTPTTVVTDDPARLDTTGLTLSATGNVQEGGEIIYTARVTNPTGTEMKVTLSNGETITIGKGQTEGSITIPAPQNTVYVDAGNVSVTITGTTGGDFEKLETSSTPAVTAVSDSVDTSTVTLTATPSAVEGGVVTYTASVTAPVTGTALVISLANGQSITIPVNATSGSVDFIAPNNVLNTNTPLTNSITGVTGGNYEHLETAGTPTTVVTDDPARLDTTGLTLSATGNVQEGGEIIYTARVTNPTGTEMKVTLSNGETITIGKGQTEGSITVPAPQNTVYVDAGNVSVTITGTTGGDFEKLETSSTPAVTAVSDSVDISTVTLTATPSAVEGGVVTYTASVTAPVTGTALVISLANGQSITIPVNATSGSVDFIAPNNVLNTNTPLTNSITGVTGGNYEHLETAGTPTTVVTDDPARLDTTGLTLSATGNVQEGGEIIYTARVTNPTGTEMKVTLSNGETITIGKGQTEGSITVPAPQNTVYVDAGNVSVTITGTTGGDFEKLETSSTPAVTAVSDSVDTSTVTLTATPSAVEGGVVTYTASVTAPVTGTALVISLANGQSITIPVNATSGSVDFIAPNNVLNTNTPLTNSITGVTGGNYEHLETAGTPTTVVTDDPARLDTTGLTLSATGNVQEGGEIIYTARVTNPTGTEMKVTLSNGETITIGKGQTEGSITVPAPQNTVYVDAGNVSVTITGTTGGDFEKLETSSTPAVTAVSDSVDTSTVTLTATPSAVEGGVVTYTASVTAPVTGTALVISLANGQSITIPVNATSGSVDFIAPNNVLNTNTPLTNSITGVTGGNYEHLETAGTPTTVVTDDPARLDTTGLTLSATGNVQEGGEIIYTARVTNPTGTEMKVTLSNGETITIGKGQTEGSITVPAPQNTVYVDAGNVSVTITGTTGGDFEKLETSSTPAVTAVSDSVDTSTVTLTATPSAVEGGVVTYTASVTAPVTGTALVISLANGQSITIPVNATSGSVDFIAPNNVLNTNTPLTNSITGVTGGNYEHLETAGTPTTVVTDDSARLDTTGLTLSATGNVQEGGEIIYTARVTNPTGTEMKVTLSNGETITIGKGQTEGSITVPAPQNTVYVDAGNVSVTITGTTGGDFEKLETSSTPAVTAVSDSVDTSTVTLTATPSAVEGGVVTYTASVTAPVTGTALVISLANGQSITIPVNATSGSVDFIAPNNVLNTNTPLTNSITGVTGGNYEHLETAGTPTTVVTDDPARLDTTGLTLSATGNVQEGGEIIYTARVTNPTGTEMKVTLSNGETITIGKGQTEGSITVPAPQNTVYVDAGNVSVTITGTTGGDFEKLETSATPAVTAVSDSVDTSTVTLTATPSAVEGGVVTYTASVTAPVTGTALVISLANGQSITIPVNATSGSVDFIAPNNVLNTNTPLTNSITGVTGGNYEHLETAGTPTTVVTDDPARLDTTGLTLSATGNVQEGGEIVYTARVTNPTGTEMKVTLSNGETITIGKGQTEGSITVPAPQNTVYVDAGNHGRHWRQLRAPGNCGHSDHRRDRRSGSPGHHRPDLERHWQRPGRRRNHLHRPGHQPDWHRDEGHPEQW